LKFYGQPVGKILVTGATGNVGKHIVSSLAGLGLEVRALVRDPAKTSTPKGVEVARGDLSSPETLDPALHDVDSVYLMWPGIPVEPGVVKAIDQHAKRIVYLSTDVADLADKEEATSFHQEIERQIRNSGLNWTFCGRSTSPRTRSDGPIRSSGGSCAGRTGGRAGR
jgi:uncharacterized protein YbjT (DUF2867 family)